MSIINKIADALRDDNNENIASLIDKAKNINEKDMYGNPLLNIAAEKGDLEAVKLLLEAGADLNATDDFYGRTALIWAEKNGHKSVVEILKSSDGNSLYTVSISGGEYILACAESGNIDEIEKLIESGADIEQRDSSNNTPLIVATYSGHESIVKLLIKSGANLDSQGDGGYNALILAVIYGYSGIVKSLLDADADTSIMTQGGATAFSKAQDEGNEDIIKLLESDEEKTEETDEDYETQSISETFIDPRDGKEYKTIKVGGKIWMAENLKYNLIKKAVKILGIFTKSKAEKKSYVYDNYEYNCDTYGRLYKWNDALEACPPGWHIPSDDEWKELEVAIGMSEETANRQESRGTNEGGYLKSLENWNHPNTNARDEIGFSAFASGHRTSKGEFIDKGDLAPFWTSTEYDEDKAWYRLLYYNYADIGRYTQDKSFAFPIRCVKD